MIKLIFPILLTVLFAAHRAFAQIPSCPCDTLEFPDGNTGDSIVEILCPGGNLASGNDSIVTQDEVLIATPEGETPLLGYHVGIAKGDFKFCQVSDDGISNVPIELSDQEFENCKDSLVERCSLGHNPIPTLSEWGMIAMAGVLGMIGLYIAARRRKAAA